MRSRAGAIPSHIWGVSGDIEGLGVVLGHQVLHITGRFVQACCADSRTIQG